MFSDPVVSVKIQFGTVSRGGLSPFSFAVNTHSHCATIGSLSMVCVYVCRVAECGVFGGAGDLDTAPTILSYPLVRGVAFTHSLCVILAQRPGR